MDANRDRTAPRGHVPAVRNATRLLRRLAASLDPLPASALARSLELPRSSTYELLATLAADGLVVHLPERRAWTLGIGAFELGSAYLRHEPLEHLARPLLTRLTQRLGETSLLGILDGHELLYLLKQLPDRPADVVSDVGVRLPAHLTASGRILLAWLPKEQVDAVVRRPGGLGTRTGAGPGTRRELDELMRADRAANHAVEDGAVTAGFTAVASAAFDHTGRPVAAVAVPFPRDRYPEPRWPELAAHTRRTADTLTRRLGGTPPPARTGRPPI